MKNCLFWQLLMTCVNLLLIALTTGTIKFLRQAERTAGLAQQATQLNANDAHMASDDLQVNFTHQQNQLVELRS